MNTNKKDTMKTIKYKDKEYKLPFKVGLPEDPTTEEVVHNRFGGESCTLPAFAVAVYDVILGSEMLKQWDTHRQGLDWFSRNFTKEYMVLLD
jgi:hypothetical protein